MCPSLLNVSRRSEYDKLLNPRDYYRFFNSLVIILKVTNYKKLKITFKKETGIVLFMTLCYSVT